MWRIHYSVYCPFYLLRLFKEGAPRSKTEFTLLSDTHAIARACLKPTETYLFTKGQIWAGVRVWDPRKRSKKMRENYIAGFKGYSDTHAC